VTLIHLNRQDDARLLTANAIHTIHARTTGRIWNSSHLVLTALRSDFLSSLDDAATPIMDKPPLRVPRVPRPGPLARHTPFGRWRTAAEIREVCGRCRKGGEFTWPLIAAGYSSSMSIQLVTLQELRAGDRITGLIRPDQTVIDKQDWVVKAPWGIHPQAGAPCLQMEPLDGHPNYAFNLWACDLEHLAIGFWIARPD
jgi:hypothetical protein